MNEANSLECIEAFVKEYMLRYVEKDKHFLGLFKGLFIDVWEHKGSVWISFCSPTVRLGEAIVDKFNSFTHVAKTSIPTEWFQHRYVGDQVDTKGCLLELNDDRLAKISNTDLLALPEVIALEFQERGADAENPTCSLCNLAKADKLLYADDKYQTACNACFDNLRDFFPGGIVTIEPPIRWVPAAISLILGSAAFTLVWGFLQQGEEGVSIEAVLVAPFFASIGLCVGTARAARGMNRWLRILTITCIIFSIVTGNIWGMHTAILRQQQISWIDTVELYFTWALTHEESNAWWFLLGGAAGVWVCFGMLKNLTVIKYR